MTINNEAQSEDERPLWLRALTLEDLEHLFELNPLAEVRLENVVLTRILHEAEEAKVSSDIARGRAEGKQHEIDKQAIADQSTP